MYTVQALLTNVVIKGNAGEVIPAGALLIATELPAIWTVGVLAVLLHARAGGAHGGALVAKVRDPLAIRDLDTTRLVRRRRTHDRRVDAEARKDPAHPSRVRLRNLKRVHIELHRARDVWHQGNMVLARPARAAIVWKEVGERLLLDAIRLHQVVTHCRQPILVVEPRFESELLHHLCDGETFIRANVQEHDRLRHMAAAFDPRFADLATVVVAFGESRRLLTDPMSAHLLQPA